MKPFLRGLLYWSCVLGGLAAAVLVVPLGLVSEAFLDGVTAVVFPLGLVAALVVLAAVISERRAGQQKLLVDADAPAIIGGFVAMLVFCWTLTGWIGLVVGATHKIFLWALDPQTGRFPALVLCVPLTFCAALFAFWVRLRLRSVYGLTEVMVGLLVALWQVVSAAPDKPLLEIGQLLGLLTAGVYLVVGGLDNIRTGWTAPEPDRVVRWIRRMVARTAAAAPDVQAVASTPEVGPETQPTRKRPGGVVPADDPAKP